MAMACPKRKQILKEKEERERERQKNKSMQTYAEVAKLFKDEQQQNKVQIHIENNTPLHVLQCMLHAHLMNIGRPGTFNIELNKILKENGFQEMKFPDNPPSGEILQVTKMMPKTPPSHEASSERMEEEDSASQPEKKGNR